MAVKKVLVDHNVPEPVRVHLNDLGWRAVSSRELLPKGQEAQDRDILRFGGKKKWHLLTGDADFLQSRDYPCNDYRDACRTCLDIPTAKQRDAGLVIKAWHKITWDKVRHTRAIRITLIEAIIYECNGDEYVEVDRFAL